MKITDDHIAQAIFAHADMICAETLATELRLTDGVHVYIYDPETKEWRREDR